MCGQATCPSPPGCPGLAPSYRPRVGEARRPSQWMPALGAGRTPPGPDVLPNQAMEQLRLTGWEMDGTTGQGPCQSHTAKWCGHGVGENCGQYGQRNKSSTALCRTFLKNQLLFEDNFRFSEQLPGVHRVRISPVSLLTTLLHSTVVSLDEPTVTLRCWQSPLLIWVSLVSPSVLFDISTGHQATNWLVRPPGLFLRCSSWPTRACGGVLALNRGVLCPPPVAKGGGC